MKFLFLFLLFSPLSFATEKDPRAGMQVLAQEITALQKYLLSEATFSAPENSAAIQKSLKRITEHVKGLPATFKGDAALSTNAALLASHMEETTRLFEGGKKSFARYMAQSSLQMCISCHTREKSVDFALPESDLGALSPIEKANFFFATRQFEKGRDIYAQVVASYPGSLNSTQLRHALLSLAVFYARVKESPKEAAEYFSMVSKRAELPAFLAAEVGAWAKDFSAWAKEKPAGLDKATETQLLAEAKKILSADDFSLIGDSDRKFHVRRLRASALLHRALETSGTSPAKGEAILLLGQIYDRIAYNLFFRFGEMYLKACVREHKKTKIARRCYDALEEIVAEGYTGSSGMNIPEEEQVELFQLRRLAY
jgi:cytochrome c553